MSADLLQKHHYKVESSRKYYVNCDDDLAKNPESLKLNTLVKYDNDKHIIKALAHEYLHFGEIIIKMGRFDQTIGKEYEIGKILSGIPGFVEFICLFQCYDDTGNILPKSICQAPIKSRDSNKLVLIMPYYELGSVKNYSWRGSDTPILRSILKQLVVSCYVAYLNIGFLHSDLHLDNVLLAKTALEYITYSDDFNIKTNGYQISIMDFEMSFIGIQNTRANRQLFWSDYLTTFNRLYELKTVVPFNLEKILHYLNIARVKFYALYLDHIYELINLIDLLYFESADLRVKVPTYNPNIF